MFEVLLEEKGVTDALAEGAIQPGTVTTSGLTAAAQRILGNKEATTGAIEELTAADVRTLIDFAASVGGALVAGTNVTITDNGNGTFTIASSGGAGGSFRGALVKRSADQTANFTTQASVAWDTKVYDTDSIHDNATNNTRLTVPSGVTHVRLLAGFQIDSNSGAWADAVIVKNGSSTYDGRGAVRLSLNSATTNLLNVTTAVLPVTAGDYFEAQIRSASDTSVTVLASVSWFAMEIIE